VALDPSGTKLITGDLDGILRVGPITGETPHLLYGHESWLTEVSVTPDGKWIGSIENGNPVLRLWQMPDGKPFQALTHDEFLTRLHASTNIRVEKDVNSSTGYKIEYAPFAGWENLSIW